MQRVFDLKRGSVAVIVSFAVSVSACGSKGGDASASAAASGSASAVAGGTKACCDAFPYCVMLPSGWSVGKPQTGADWANCDVKDDKSKTVATLYTNPVDQYDGQVAGDKSFMDAGTEVKNEPLAGGKGVYHEWNSKDAERKGRDHMIQSYMKDAKLWHCSAMTDKTDTGPLAGTVAAVCKSMVAK